jgi:hypothetical protein
MSEAIGGWSRRGGQSNPAHSVFNPGGVSNVTGPNQLATDTDWQSARFARKAQARPQTAGNAGASIQSDRAQRFPRSSDNRPSTETWTALRAANLTPDQIYNLPQAEFAAAAKQVATWETNLIRCITTDQILSWYFSLYLKTGSLSATALKDAVRRAYPIPAGSERRERVIDALDNISVVTATAEQNRNTLLRDYPQYSKKLIEDALYVQMRPEIRDVLAGREFSWRQHGPDELLWIATGTRPSTTAAPPSPSAVVTTSPPSTMAAVTSPPSTTPPPTVKPRTGWQRCLWKYCPGDLSPWAYKAGSNLGTEALRLLATSNGTSPPRITSGAPLALARSSPTASGWGPYAPLIPIGLGAAAASVYRFYRSRPPAGQTAPPGGPQAEVAIPLIPLPTQATNGLPQYIPATQRRYSV